MKPTPSEDDAPHHDVFLGYLTGNEVSQSFHRCFIDVLGFDLSGPQRLKTWGVGRPNGPLGLPRARNMLVEEMLATEAQWLWMVDSDMGFTQDTLTQLLAVADPKERPVVGALCFAMREAMGDGMGGWLTFPAPTILNWTKQEDGIERFVGRDHYPVNTMIQVGATGAACLLMHRSVLEQIESDWFTLLPSNDGKMQGEDISFCDRLRQRDIPVWVHTGVRTTHYKHLWLAESDFWSSRISPPATERVDVIVPTVGGRVDNIARLLKTLRASTGLATAHYICDPGDVDTATEAALYGAKVLFEPGSFAHKVNWAYRKIESEAPWMLLVGDDVSFRPGWLDQAQDVAFRWEGLVVGTNDLTNPRVLRGEHATHPMIRRGYIAECGASFDGPGVVCHEGYTHNFVDDEIVWAAKGRRVFQSALGSHVEHHHPLNGKVEADDVYRRGAESYEADQKLFQTRLKDFLMQQQAKPKLAIARS